MPGRYLDIIESAFKWRFMIKRGFHIISIVIVLVLPFHFFGCTEKGSDFEKFQRLEGTWSFRTNGSEIVEKWQKQNDSLYYGESFEITTTDTMLTEKLAIKQTDTGVYYIPIAYGQNQDKPVPFRLDEVSGLKFTFINPEHDFPTKIVYDLDIEDELNASVSGFSAGQVRTIRFPYKRK